MSKREANVVSLETHRGKRPRARMSGQERREQLIRVARGVFAQRGYEATSVEEIADKADVSKPIVYGHFGGKEGLYAVVIDREVRDLLGRITSSLNAQHPRAILEQAAKAFLTYIEAEPDGFRILLRDTPSVGTAPAFASLIGDVAAQVEYVLVEEFKSRGYDPKLAPLYAHGLVGMVAQVGEWWLHTGKPQPDTVVAHLVNLAWNGLKDLERRPGVHSRG